MKCDKCQTDLKNRDGTTYENLGPRLLKQEVRHTHERCNEVLKQQNTNLEAALAAQYEGRNKAEEVLTKVREALTKPDAWQTRVENALAAFQAPHKDG
jgi:hypothetical protein